MIRLSQQTRTTGPHPARELRVRPSRRCETVQVNDGRVRYAGNGSVRLAYRVFGEADTTVVWTPGAARNVESFDDPASPFAMLAKQLSQVTRLVVWDMRGGGLSDAATQVPPLTERVEDLRAVMDAAGVESATLFGFSEGGATSVLFAATYPQRVRSLVLYGTATRFSQELPDFPWGLTPAQVEARTAEIDNDWGSGALCDILFGEATETPGMREWVGKIQRSMHTPTMARLTWQALMNVDIRDVLQDIDAPTLVLARPDDQLAPPDAAAALAAGIRGAQLRTLPPGAHNTFDIFDLLGAHVVEFAYNTPSAAPSERVLTTVVFTDIVGSTEQLRTAGDAHWRGQLDAHDQLVAALLPKYGGRRAKHTGDGIFALFDGPTSAARCALDLVPALAARGIRIRVGIHVGECEKRGEEWSGMAVHIGARIGSLAGPGEILASRTVRDLSAGSGMIFEHFGAHRLKGLPEEIDIYRVSKP
ncbi:MAG: alpha/beta fold hydrolase [Mycobacterium sp.]|uniref:adenylate/guanylate cyclase domain-containing protein n=1 Tax=Mycobacterium sp. TaxID=1785 RepID=UPI00389A87BB